MLDSNTHASLFPHQLDIKVFGAETCKLAMFNHQEVLDEVRGSL